MFISGSWTCCSEKKVNHNTIPQYITWQILKSNILSLFQDLGTGSRARRLLCLFKSFHLICPDIKNRTLPELYTRFFYTWQDCRGQILDNWSADD